MCRTLNYFSLFYIFVCAVSGFVSISSYTSLVDISVSMTSSAVGFKICALTAGIKKYKLIKKKKKEA